MKYHLGIADAKRTVDTHTKLTPALIREIAIIWLTPGMAQEWVEHNFALRYENRKKAKRVARYAEAHRLELEPLALENAASITLEDGHAMVELTRRFRRYKGALPHYACLALLDMRSKLGYLGTMNALNWKRSRLSKMSRSRFHPLTLQRTTPRPGRPPKQVT